MIKGALFDMDGVLVDNAEMHGRAFEIFCSRYGVNDWQQKFTSVFGMGNDDIMRLLLPASLVEERGTQSLSDEKEAIYREIYAPTIEPVKGLRELLRHLRGNGVRCAVGSSGCRANVEFVLEKCGIAEYFDAQVNGDRVSRCKPDPEIYLTAAAELGLEPQECVVFEDAVAGIEAASRAGVRRTIALATSLSAEKLRTTQAAYIVADFREVTDEMLR